MKAIHSKLNGLLTAFMLTAIAALLAGCGASDVAGSSSGGGAANGSPTLTIALSTNSIGSGTSATVTATLLDATGSGITSTVVTFETSATYGNLNQTTALTNASGVATVTLSQATNAPAGASTISAAANGLTASTGYAVGGGIAPTVAAMAVATSSSSITADGFTTATISATACSVALVSGSCPSGSGVPSVTVNFSKSAGTLSASSAITNASGVAQVILTSPTTTGGATVVAAESSGSSGSVNVTFVPGIPAKISIGLSPTSVAAGSTATFSATVTDINNNVVATGTSVAFSTSSSTGGAFVSTPINTNALGVASVTYTAGTCASATCTETLIATAGGASGSANLMVSNSNTSVASVGISLGSSSITANGASYTYIRALVKDSLGAAVSGATVSFTTTAGSFSSTVPPATAASTAVSDANGIAQLYLISPIIIGNANVMVGTAGTSAQTSVSFTAGAPSAVGLNAQPTTVLPGGSATMTAGVVDANGNPVSGETVNFYSTVGGVATNLGTTTTNASGIATKAYIAGSTVGTESLTAKTTNGTTSPGVTFTITNAGTVAGSLVVSSSTSSIVADGSTSSTISATVKDSSGIAMSGVSVSFSTTGGTLSAASATTNASGIATVTLTSSVATMTATVSAGFSGFNNSTDIQFTQGAASVVGLNAAPNSLAPSGTSTITAVVLDANGNPVVNEMVSFAFTVSGSGSPKVGQFNTTPLLTTVSVPTDDSGLAKIAYAAGANNGADTISATTSNAVTKSTSIAVSSSNVAIGSLIASSNSGSIPVTTGTTTIRATVKDTSNVAIQGVSVTFAASAGSLSAATAVTDANGFAQVTLTSGANILNAMITASSGGFSSSTNVNFTAGASNSVTMNAAPGTVIPSGSSSISALVTDVNLNPVVGEVVSFAITTKGSGLPELGSATAVTNANGLAIVAYTAGSGAGTDTITATTSNEISKTQNVIVNASATVVSSLTVSAGATTLPADSSSSTAIQATVTDSSGAPAVGVTVNFSTTAGSLSFSSATTNASGLATVTLTSSSNLGSANVIASASGFSESVSVGFVAGTPAGLALSGSPAAVSAGLTSTLNALVLDGKGNPVVGQTVTFVLTANVSGATLSAATAVSNSSGLANVTYTSGDTPGTDTITATLANGFSTTANIVVSASTTPTAAKFSLSASPVNVKSDNSGSTTITLTALSSTNAATPDVVVILSATTGILSTQTVTTNSVGNATFNFSSGSIAKYNRTATITATSAGATSNLPISIVDSTVSITTATTNLTTGIPATLTVTTKDAGGNAVSDQELSYTISSGSGTLSTGTGKTDAAGTATVSFTGTAAGSASVKIDWLDAAGGSSTASATQTFTVASAGNAFEILTPSSSPFPVPLGTNQAVIAYVPADINTANDVKSVRFSTTLGTWFTSTTSSETQAFVAAGNYTATFVTGSNAGNANVQIDLLDSNGAILTSAAQVMSLSATAANANSLTLQANVTSISPSTGSTSSTATITAMVRDSSNNPVGNAPVLFSLNNPTGSGESISPVLVMTAATASNNLAVGQAQTIFTAGALPTNQQSQITASVVGTPAATASTYLTVGGTAGSVAIGTSTTISSINNDTTYQLPITLLVTDSNGSAVSNAVVSLSIWPTVYYKGYRDLACNASWVASFQNEDSNENLILNSGEDVDGEGGAAYFSTIASAATSTGTAVTLTVPTETAISAFPTSLSGQVSGCNVSSLNTTGITELTWNSATSISYNNSTTAGNPSTADCSVLTFTDSNFKGAIDGILWPPSSSAGSLPQTVTTGSDGTASFYLTYLKNYADWLKVRIRAKTSVQGSETTSESVFILSTSAEDVITPCPLPHSPFN